MKYLIILSIILAILFTSRGTYLRFGDSYKAKDRPAVKIQRMLINKLFNDDSAESKVSSIFTYFLCNLLFSSQELL